MRKWILDYVEDMVTMYESYIAGETDSEVLTLCNITNAWMSMMKQVDSGLDTNVITFDEWLILSDVNNLIQDDYMDYNEWMHS